MLRNALCVQAALGSDRDDVVLHGVILSVTQWVEKTCEVRIMAQFAKIVQFSDGLGGLSAVKMQQ